MDRALQSAEGCIDLRNGPVARGGKEPAGRHAARDRPAPEDQDAARPYANLTYAQSSWDQFTRLATTFAVDDNESLSGRAGVRLGTDLHISGSRFTKVFAGLGLGVVCEFDGENTASIVSGGTAAPLTHEVDASSLELQGGISVLDAVTGWSLSITSTGRISEDTEAYGGRATVNYKF